MAPTDPNMSGGSDDPVRVEHQHDSETPPSIAIVRAIAVIEDVDPVDSPSNLGITLNDHIDPTALDRLVTGTDEQQSVTIELTIHSDDRYTVRVRDTGRLVVEKGG